MANKCEKKVLGFAAKNLKVKDENSSNMKSVFLVISNNNNMCVCVCV